jgi:UDP-2-acetamido-3-amino-2,3-dideoxy-glucuronate N-acetyltransferase
MCDYFVHESAYVEEGAVVGKGTKIWYFTHVMSGAQIGENCLLGQGVFIDKRVKIGDNVKIMNNVSVYDMVTIEDDVFCGPSMTFTNVKNPRAKIQRGLHEYLPTLVKHGASIGANATIVCGNTIGRYAFVGAGSVVTKDVPDYAIVYGNPARVAGWMCECGLKLDFTPGSTVTVCVKCRKKYKKHAQTVETPLG